MRHQIRNQIDFYGFFPGGFKIRHYLSRSDTRSTGLTVGSSVWLWVRQRWCLWVEDLARSMGFEQCEVMASADAELERLLKETGKQLSLPHDYWYIIHGFDWSSNYFYRHFNSLLMLCIYAYNYHLACVYKAYDLRDEGSDYLGKVVSKPTTGKAIHMDTVFW
ncbi:uncharacterized protein LOC110927723 [Helianthus annuus]|uniref:uncharacterized protein LOC110927723 n=1 Tax=Helianthus annuus TaxID=4232 RepID=UPI001652E50D|nr:uncharacterized protein LOC110927723 [Helianthus annuus]